MKRIILCFLLICFLMTCFTFNPVMASAEEEVYLLIDRDNVYLYADSYKKPPLFILPTTYYVKVIESLDEYYYLVEYNGIQGLVKSSEVSSKTETNVHDPYYTSLNISAHISTHLYKRPSFADAEDSGIVAYGLSLTYLGKISGEKGTYGTSTWFAVLYSGSIYYIHSAMTENLDLLEKSISPHPNSLSSTPSEESSKTSEKKDPDSSSSVDIVRILLIVGMFVPIVIILVVLFRPKRKRSRRESREEEEDDY